MFRYNRVKALGFSPDQSLLTGVTGENTLSVWNIGSRRLVASMDRLALGAGTTAVISPDNQLLATVVEGLAVQLWRLQPTALLRTLHGPRQDVFLAFSPEGRHLAVASSDASLRLWDLSTGRVTSLPRALMAYYCVTFSPDGRRLAAAGPDPVVRIIDVSTGDEVAALPKSRAFTWAVRFTPDGDNLLALDEAGLTVWRAASARERPKLLQTEGK